MSDDLQAWCNGYEVIAATSEVEAREVLLTLDWYADPEDIDGDGWEILPDDQPILEEDGTPIGETIGDAVRAEGKPGHLWSVAC